MGMTPIQRFRLKQHLKKIAEKKELLKQMEKDRKKRAKFFWPVSSRWKRFKKWSTIDHWIDLSVDIGLIAFDVLSSPILILVRSVRYFLNKYVNKHIKRFLKWFVHKVLKIQ